MLESRAARHGAAGTRSDRRCTDAGMVLALDACVSVLKGPRFQHPLASPGPLVLACGLRGSSAAEHRFHNPGEVSSTLTPATTWGAYIATFSTYDSPFDLVAYRVGKFHRIQVKFRTVERGTVTIQLRRASICGGKVKMLPNTEVDWGAIYCPQTDQCYYVPAAKCPLSLRIEAPRNGQRQGINLASDFKDFY